MYEVNLRDEEYNKVQKKLVDYHKDEIKNIKNTIKDIRQLLEDGKTFQLEQTTKNLLMILSTMESDILPQIESTFENTEQYVSTVITGFNNIDTIC